MDDARHRQNGSVIRSRKASMNDLIGTPLRSPKVAADVDDDNKSIDSDDIPDTYDHPNHILVDSTQSTDQNHSIEILCLKSRDNKTSTTTPTKDRLSQKQRNGNFRRRIPRPIVQDITSSASENENENEYPKMRKTLHRSKSFITSRSKKDIKFTRARASSFKFSPEGKSTDDVQLSILLKKLSTSPLPPLSIRSTSPLPPLSKRSTSLFAVVNPEEISNPQSNEPSSLSNFQNIFHPVVDSPISDTHPTYSSNSKDFEPLHSPTSMTSFLDSFPTPRDFLSLPNFHRKLLVNEGKQVVTYSTVGDPTGKPVLVLMGLGAHRIYSSTFHNIAIRNHLFLVWPDRPGIGGSTSISVNIRIANFSTIINSLAKELNISKFTIIAQSCGVIYALALSKTYPELIQQPLLIASPWVPTSQSNTLGWTKLIPDFAIKSSYLIPRQVNVPKPLEGLFQFSFGNNMATPSYSGVNMSHNNHSTDDIVSQDSANSTLNHTQTTARLEIKKSFSGLSPRMEKNLRQYCEEISQKESRKGDSDDIVVCLNRSEESWLDYYSNTPEMLVWYGENDTMVTRGGIEWFKNITNSKVKTLKWLSHSQVVEVSWVVKDIFRTAKAVSDNQDPEFKDGPEELDDFVSDSEEPFEILKATNALLAMKM